MLFSKEYFVLALDIETSGSSKLKNGIVSIGASLQSANSKELESFQINLHLESDKAYDLSCLQEFWYKHPEIYKFVNSNALNAKDALLKFGSFVNNIELKYNKFNNLQIVSDNPCFDIAWLNDYLEIYTDFKLLNYSINGNYRFIWDINSMMKTLLAITQKNRQANWGFADRLNFSSQWHADHNPLNDARCIADYYNQIIKKMSSLSKIF